MGDSLGLYLSQLCNRDTMHSDCMPWIDDIPDKVNTDCSLKYIWWRNRAEYQKLDHQYTMY